jgi:hypothetical protein
MTALHVFDMDGIEDVCCDIAERGERVACRGEDRRVAYAHGRALLDAETPGRAIRGRW